MTRRALIIRSDYDPPPGAHNAAECIGQVLQARGFELVPCIGPAATRRGILRAYDEVIARATADDAIVVYYAGHGGLATNSGYAQGDDLPRYIQHICPTDFAATTDDDFRGISSFELSLQLAALTERTTNVTVILECCFAAEMSRGEEAATAPASPPTLTRVGLTRHLQELRARACGFGALPVTGNPNAVRVAASGQTELARRVELPSAQALSTIGLESSRHDEWIGAMTLGLAQILAEIGDTPVPWRSIAPALRARLLVQRPEIEGPIARVPFSLVTVDANTFALRLDDLDRGAAIVEAGQLLGVSVGDVYGVMPAGSRSVDPSTLVATLTIGEVSATRSRAHRIEWKNGHRDLPANAAAVAISLAVERAPVRIVAPDAARDAVTAALQSSRRLRAATDADGNVLGELRVLGAELELRDALGPLFPPVRFADRLGDAVLDLENLATERWLRALAEDGGIAPTAVKLELGRVGTSGTFLPIRPHGEPLGLGDSLALRLENTTDETLYANAFNIGLQRRIYLLSGAAASGVALPPHEPVCIGDTADGELRGFSLSWPDGLPADRPRLDTALVIITADATDLRVLESHSHLARSRSALTPLQDLLAQLASGQPRGGMKPAPYAIHWRDYQLFPISGSLDAGVPEVEASPPGSGVARTAALANLRVRFEAIERTPATVRIDVLVCARSAASPFRATTYLPGEPADPVVWLGEVRGPVDVYVWTSDAEDRRPLAELLATRPIGDAIALLRAPDEDPRVQLAGGASLQLAAVARASIARISRTVATAFRGSLGSEVVGARRYTAAATAFTIVIDRVDSIHPAASIWSENEKSCAR